MFDREQGGMTPEEMRKKRRKKERMQAFGLLGGILAVSVLIGIIVINAALGNFTRKQEKEVVKQEEEKTAEPNTVSDDSAASQVTEAVEQEEEVAQAIDEATVTYDELLDEAVNAYIQNMTLEEKVAGLFIVTPENLTGVGTVTAAGSSTSEALGKYPVGGIVYDASNITDEQQLSDMIFNTKSFSKYEMFIAITDEGGSESPLFSKGLTTEEVMGQKEIGETGGAAGAYSAGLALSSQMIKYGINVDFAPLADTLLVDNSYIADRAYGTDRVETASLAKKMINGLQDGSVNACLKYFPGYGDSKTDPKQGRCSSNRTKEDIAANEYGIVKEAMSADVKLVMISHMTMPKVDDTGVPASMSKIFVTDMLRTELGYDGVVVTDYMSKGAISENYKQADAAVAAIQAGCDMILAPSDFKKAYQGVLDAVADNTLSEERINESLRRIYRVKLKDTVQDPAAETENAGATTDTTGTTDNAGTAE